ncbi:FliO/MopB family protein [Flavisphingomonas formosensis]|uniref:FliO/MopB family protein n=1 Tax=Flavisphingomonas formosensis TaxID=861534 RepID=UPI0012F953C6|nr:flagellar biosynthetic protein FliO [Sphingomonas formosensis]
MTSARLRPGRRPWLAGLAVASVATPALALGNAVADDTISYWRVLASLILCLALAVGGAFALRARFGANPLPRMLQQGRERRLRLIEIIRLNPQTQLCIIRCDGEDLLVAATPQSVTVLRSLPLPLPAQEGDGRACA